MYSIQQTYQITIRLLCMNSFSLFIWHLIACFVLEILTPHFPQLYFMYCWETVLFWNLILVIFCEMLLKIFSSQTWKYIYVCFCMDSGICSDNGLLLVRCHTITQANADLSSTGPSKLIFFENTFENVCKITSAIYLGLNGLTHWGRDKMDVISLTFSSAFPWMKRFEFRLKFHWSLFLRVQLTIFQHWFR